MKHISSLMGVLVLIAVTSYSTIACDFDRGDWTDDCTASDKLAYAKTEKDYALLSDPDWHSLSVQDLQSNPDAVKEALKSNKLTESQKTTYFGSPQTDLTQFDMDTLITNKAYIPVDDRLVSYASTLEKEPFMRFWDTAGTFQGAKDNPEFWSQLMSQGNIQRWMKEGDLDHMIDFMADLNFQEQLAAAVAFIQGNYDLQYAQGIPSEALRQALQSLGKDIPTLAYNQNNQVSITGGILDIDGNKFDLDALDQGTHSINAQEDAVDYQATNTPQGDINAQGATGLTLSADGSLFATNVNSLIITPIDGATTKLLNAQGVSYSQGTLHADSAELIVKDQTLANIVDNYDSDYQEFHVQKADIVYRDGLKFYELHNVTFRETEDT